MYTLQFLVIFIFNTDGTIYLTLSKWISKKKVHLRSLKSQVAETSHNKDFIFCD
jgi:hypothetical protein